MSGDQLGTTERDDGSTQVTYNGWPLITSPLTTCRERRTARVATISGLLCPRQESWFPASQPQRPARDNSPVGGVTVLFVMHSQLEDTGPATV